MSCFVVVHFSHEKDLHLRTTKKIGIFVMSYNEMALSLGGVFHISMYIFILSQAQSGYQINNRKSVKVAVKKCCSPWCVRTCWLRIAFWRKCLPHSGNGHSKGFSPLWIRRCWFKMARWRKLRGQYAHVYGFSFAWIRRCCVKWLCCRNRFPHSGHPYGLNRNIRKFNCQYHGKITRKLTELNIKTWS